MVSEHIEIDIHFVRDLVATSAIRVLHVPSRYQYADIFTKGLPTSLFDEFRTRLSVRCPPAPTAGECAKVQLQVERKVQEHMRQRELEANAHEEAREREWQRKMDDINSMLRKFNDPRPPQ
ncbi:ribonuclease H-like domain-containing protein [Tanacetum coccineum]